MLQARARAGQWMCVEHMVKLNQPVSAFNGEHAIWLNGVKVAIENHNGDLTARALVDCR